MTKKQLQFRAWDKKEQKMFYPKEVHDERIVMQLNGTIGLFNGKAYDTVTNRFIIEEYIGIDDMNSKNIYRGDIISFIFAPNTLNERHTGIVETDKWGNWTIRVKDGFFHIQNALNSEVVGNIHIKGNDNK